MEATTNSEGTTQSYSTAQVSTTSSKKRRVSHAGAAKKGKAFEREIANRLGHIFPEAERMLEYQASKVIGVDIEGTDRIKIQCKNHANYCSIGTINEIKIKNETDIPVLVTKGIRMEAMAVLPFEKLVTLLEIAYGLELPFRTFKPVPLPNAMLGELGMALLKTDKSEGYLEIPYSDTPRNFKDIEAGWVQNPAVAAQIKAEREEWDEMQREIAEMEEAENDHSSLDDLI